MIVEAESNDNCDTSFFARFKEVGPARPVVQVRLYERNPTGEWCWVTGWSDNEQGRGWRTSCMEGSMVYGSGPSNSMSLGVSRAPINGERRICPSPMSVMCVTPVSCLCKQGGDPVPAAYSCSHSRLGRAIE